MKSIATDRKGFERNFFILGEMLRDNRLRFVKDSRGVEQLKKIRFLPNGRLNFLTIDEIARLTANMAANMENRNLETESS